MRITTILTASAIALAAGVGSASADENFGTLDGISAFDSRAGIQAIPLDTAEMASIKARHWVKVKYGSEGTMSGTPIKTKGIWSYTAEGKDRHDGVKYFGRGGANFVALNDPDAGEYDNLLSDHCGCVP